jgi:mRNA interferase MazF
MARILRGDILWADLEPIRGREQGGRRPVVIITHEAFNSRSGTVIALAITSQPQKAAFR